MEWSIRLPEKVKYIIDTLMSHGYEAYAVGGCVRDSILGRLPGDWDITTSAMPEETKALFDKTFDTGIEHGTITILLGHEGFEVTTYRIDGKYEDSRHPKEVTFTRNLKDDLLRRDFTINAMAYNERDGLVDIFGGMEDLERRVIRCVGNPYERLSEDALRILRGIRFAGQLGFSIDGETKEAMRALAENLRKISAERIQVELVKTITSDRPEILREAYYLGITHVFLPEFDAMMETTQENPHHCYTVGEHTIKAMQSIPNDKILRLTMLLHDIGKPVTKTMDVEGVAHFYKHDVVGADMAKNILKRLKFDNNTIHQVTHLIRHHDERIGSDPCTVRREMNRIGPELFGQFMLVRRADTMAQSDFQKMEKLQNLNNIQRTWTEIVESKQCVSLKDLAVNGKDLIEAGAKPGKQIGWLLSVLLDKVIVDPDINTKEALFNLARERNLLQPLQENKE
ncbi:MAG: HD domain-containing protein [Dorea sp.]|nr:HD domain-containing protein [Dorea sp.]